MGEDHKFSGGSDEGYLNVDVSGSKDRESNTKFEQEIEEWAWQAYSYSGAGGGDGYGDDVLYSIVSKTATISSWYMERTESAPENGGFEIAE